MPSFLIRGAQRQRRSHTFIESLESRIAPATLVFSIERAGDAGTQAPSVDYVVTFTEAVTGVDASDFNIFTSGAARADAAVTITPTADAAVYGVTITGVGGSGGLRLDLIDDDSIEGRSGVLGGAGLANGSFQGEAYEVLQLFPRLVSITASGYAGETNPTWTVTFDEAVTGVHHGHFRLAKSDGVIGDARVVVVPTADPAVYTVIGTNVTGQGTVALQFVDDASVVDRDGNPLQTTAWSFAAPQAYVTGTFPQWVAIGDLNGDGHPDIVAANAVYGEDRQSVSVLLNRGDGTFDYQRRFATDARPMSVAIDDLNGDGWNDIVTANHGSDSISVLLGAGDGTFAPHQTFAVGDEPSSVVIADFDQDGRPDVATANFLGDSVSVLLGNGDGTFQAQQVHATGNGPTSLRTGDVNGDGWLDLAAANFDGASVSVLLATGAGAFASQRVIPTAGWSVNLALGDIDGDGTAELVVAHYGAKLSVILDPVAGGVSSEITVPGEMFGIQPELADLDGDGILDLAAAEYGSASVFLFKGAGDGTFGSPQGFPTGVNPVSLTVGDFNGDGRPDLAVANLSTFASIVLHTGGTSFTSEPLAVDSPVGHPGIIVVAPSVPPGTKTGPIAVRVYAADTLAELAQFRPYGAAYRGTVNLAVGDLTGDGIDDIATTTGKGTGRLRVFDGATGDRVRTGPFAKEKAIFNGSTERGAYVAIGDLNGDGRNEVIAGTAFHGGAVRVFDGETGKPVPLSASGSRMLLPFTADFKGGIRVAAGDVNGDGLADLIAGQAFGGARVKVYAGETGARAAIESLPLLNFKVGPAGYMGGISVAAGDYDGDGAADLMVGRKVGPPSLVEIFSGTARTPEGDPVVLVEPLAPFDARWFDPQFAAGVRVGIADMNRDGIADLIAAVGPSGGSQVRVFNGADLTDVLGSFVAFPSSTDLGLNVAGSPPKPVSIHLA